MKHIVLIASMIVVGCTGRGRQTLDSPCLTSPPGGGEQCTGCVLDEDCEVVTNLCQPTGMCVPKNGRWSVIEIGCKDKHEPSMEKCGCVNAVCTAARK